MSKAGIFVLGIFLFTQAVKYACNRARRAAWKSALKKAGK